MTIEHNPLKQYFRRPGVYLKLPSKGVEYDQSVLIMPETGELPVFPMTAIDEITSKTPDSLYNGSAVADIIKSCIPAIKNPWAISSTDLDAILIAIRMATNGGEMEIETTCPKCDEEGKYGVNLSIILNNFVPGDYVNVTELNDLKIKFRALNYKEVTDNSIKQFEIQKLMMNLNAMENGTEKDAKISEVLKVISISTIKVLASTVEYIETPETRVTEKEYILDFLQNTDKRVFETIKNRSVSLRESTQTKPLHITCASCTHEYDQVFTLNVSDFFG